MKEFKVPLISASSILSTQLLHIYLKKVLPQERIKLLDVGCGEKPYQNYINASQHIGIDWPNTNAKDNLADVFADINFLPFTRDYFDTVLLTEVLEHLPNPKNSMIEINKVLKKHGTLILTTPFYHWIHEAPFDFYRYTEYGLNEILKTSGFKILKKYNKGGTLCCLFDLSFRLFNMYLNRISKKINLPIYLHNFLENMLIRLPQIFFSKFIIIIHSRFKYLAKVIDPEERITLGYIILAQKIK